VTAYGTSYEHTPDIRLFVELQAYFDHVDKVLDVRKDVAFESKVVAANYDKATQRWTTNTENGKIARSKYLILATGFAAKRHFPDWPGLDTFKGEIHHSSFWPQGGVNVEGKKVAVVGTGATGIQLSQEVAKTAQEFTLFQRTPNLCLPMRQRKMTAEEQEQRKVMYEKLFKERLSTFAGFPFDFHCKDTFADSAEERAKFYEYLWELGGFNFWIGTYKDVFFDAEANRDHYEWWVKKARERITDPVKRDILAPLEPPHPWGTKRPSLEQDFYETMDQPHVTIVDVNKNAVKEVVPEGIITEDGVLHKLDILALATGFDSLTGGMKNMGLKDINGVELAEKWREGTWSYLGMTCNDFPNMFFLVSHPSPTTAIEVSTSQLTNTLLVWCARSDSLLQRPNLYRCSRRMDRGCHLPHGERGYPAGQRDEGGRERMAQEGQGSQRQIVVPTSQLVVYGRQHSWQAKRTAQLDGGFSCL
jgi:cation diffusion facilitator CzcD-associated flavoprotein CzcO